MTHVGTQCLLSFAHSWYITFLCVFIYCINEYYKKGSCCLLGMNFQLCQQLDFFGCKLGMENIPDATGMPVLISLGWVKYMAEHTFYCHNLVLSVCIFNQFHWLHQI